MSFKSSMVQGLKWSTLGTVGLAAFQLIQISILTRFLPKEAFGLIALAVLVVNFTNIFVEMGLTSAIFHKQDATKNQYSSLYWLNIIISIFLYLFLFLTSKWIADFYEEEVLKNIIRILGLNIIIISIGKQHRALMQKNLIFDVIAKIDLFSYFIGLLIAVFLAWKGYGVYSLVYSTLITSLLSSVTLFYKRFKEDPIYFHFSFAETISFLKVGGFSLGSNILDFSSREIDIIIIGKFLGTEFLGIYSLAKQISLKAYSVMMPIIFNVFNPLLASLNKEKDKMETYFLKLLYGITNLTFPIYLAVILAASEILSILYGSNYTEGATTLIGLTVFQACFTIVKPSGSLQIATGRTDIGFLWTIFRNVVTIGVLYLLVKYFSPQLIAVFLGGVSLILVFFLWNVQIKRMSSIKFKTYISQFIFPIIALISTIILKIVLLDVFITIHNTFLSALIKIITGLLFYFLIVLFFDKKRILKELNFK